MTLRLLAIVPNDSCLYGSGALRVLRAGGYAVPKKPSFFESSSSPSWTGGRRARPWVSPLWPDLDLSAGSVFSSCSSS